MYKLVAIDLDGTLLDDSKKISIENISMLQKLMEKNIEVVIATGRRYWSARELTEIIKRHMIILANNGNIVRHSKNDEIISAKYLNMDDFKIVVGEGKKRDLHPIIHVDGYEEGYDIIIELDRDDKRYYNFLRNGKRLKRIENYLDIMDENVLAVVYPGYREKIRSFYSYINKEYPNIYNSHVMENMTNTEVLLEVMNPKGSKWKSLIEYANEHGIRSEEIITIGDDNNDIEMIENSGLGIAMKNANSTVKSKANIITEKDNNDSGVAFELKRVLDV